MAIIFKERGKKPRKIDSTDFGNEDRLQELLHDNPEAIPLYEIKEGVKLLVLAREYGTAAGPIDAIGTDSDGEIYIIETKLAKNADRRSVVAQALDYGASLWRKGSDFSQFTLTLEEHVRDKFDIGLRGKLADFFELEEEGVEMLLSSLEKNLDDGRFKFIVPMDEIDDRLKDIIVFINQNSRFDIYAVELEYYKLEKEEIFIPRLFGAEVKKSGGVRDGSRRTWTEEELVRDAEEDLEPDELEAFMKIYRFSKERADTVNLGTGSYGSFSPVFESVCGKSLFTLGTNRRLSFNFEWIGKDRPEARDRLKKELENIGFSFDDDWQKTRPSVLPNEWVPKTDAFIEVLKKLVA